MFAQNVQYIVYTIRSVHIWCYFHDALEWFIPKSKPNKNIHKHAKIQQIDSANKICEVKKSQNPSKSLPFLSLHPFTLHQLENLIWERFPFLKNPTTPEAWDDLLLEFYQWTSWTTNLVTGLGLGMSTNLLPKCCRGATQTWRFNMFNGPCIDKSHIPCSFSKIIQYIELNYINAKGIMITFKNQEQIP